MRITRTSRYRWLPVRIDDFEKWQSALIEESARRLGALLKARICVLDDRLLVPSLRGRTINVLDQAFWIPPPPAPPLMALSWC